MALLSMKKLRPRGSLALSISERVQGGKYKMDCFAFINVAIFFFKLALNVRLFAMEFIADYYRGNCKTHYGKGMVSPKGPGGFGPPHFLKKLK